MKTKTKQGGWAESLPAEKVKEKMRFLVLGRWAKSDKTKRLAVGKALAEARKAKREKTAK